MDLGCEFVGTETRITGLKYTSGDKAGQIFSIDDFMNEGKLSIEAEALSLLVQDYAGRHPNYASSLRLEKHPTKISFYITDGGNINFGELTKQELGEKVDSGEKLFDIIDYSDILRNTQTHINGVKQREQTTLDQAMSKWRLDSARKKVTAVAASMAALFLLYQSCNYLSPHRPEFQKIQYEDTVQFDWRLQGYETTLKNIDDFMKVDAYSANYHLDEITWFLSKVDEDKLTEQQKLKIEEIRKKLKEVKR